MNPEFWRGKRVLLTGHTGFKGSWLSLWLQILGAEVIGYALAAETPSFFQAAGVASGMRSIEGDVRRLGHLKSVLLKHQPEMLIHMAAQSLVRRSYSQPVLTYATNILGTVHVLEAARFAPGVKAVLVVTSDKCYENRETGAAFRETDPMGGKDPYSSSKGCAELVTAAYRQAFFLSPQAQTRVALASARAGNVIGGGDWAEDRLVPDIVRALLANQPPLIRNPNAVRPWQHVLDPLRGYLELMERLDASPYDFSEGWNFGPASSAAKPVSWVVQRILELWGAGPQWQDDALPRPPEAHYLHLDSSKAERRLAWRPRWDLEEALQWTVAWYKGRQQGRNGRDLALEQIRAYEQVPCSAPGGRE